MASNTPPEEPTGMHFAAHCLYPQGNESMEFITCDIIQGDIEHARLDGRLTVNFTASATGETAIIQARMEFFRHPVLLQLYSLVEPETSNILIETNQGKLLLPTGLRSGALTELPEIYFFETTSGLTVYIPKLLDVAIPRNIVELGYEKVLPYAHVVLINYADRDGPAYWRVHRDGELLNSRIIDEHIALVARLGGRPEK